MGRNAKAMEFTRSKAGFVTEMVKAEPSLTMTAEGLRVKEKFGELLALAKLRAAFIA